MLKNIFIYVHICTYVCIHMCMCRWFCVYMQNVDCFVYIIIRRLCIMSMLSCAFHGALLFFFCVCWMPNGVEWTLSGTLFKNTLAAASYRALSVVTFQQFTQSFHRKDDHSGSLWAGWINFPDPQATRSLGALLDEVLLAAAAAGRGGSGHF